MESREHPRRHDAPRCARRLPVQDATRIRGFSVTHLSGTGCRGVSGDIPFMPYAGDVTTSPSLDTKNALYASDFTHADERAEAGAYAVTLRSGVNIRLAATARTGAGRFTFPKGTTATMLIRVSDTQVGSSDADVSIDAPVRTVTGSVTSGNFCGYLSPSGRHSYYTLYFVAKFDKPFGAYGTWQDDRVNAGAASARGGTTYGTEGYPPAGKGSGGYVTFAPGSTVDVRVGICTLALPMPARTLRPSSRRRPPSRRLRLRRTIDGTRRLEGLRSLAARSPSAACSTRRCITRSCT